jgi:hypothetical protein
MKRLSPSDIAAHFRQQVETSSPHDKETAQALQELSHAIDDCKAAGLDVSLELAGQGSLLAADLFVPYRYVAVCASGILRTGQSTYLLALATSIDHDPCLKLAISAHDPRFYRPHTETRYDSINGRHVECNTVPGSVYDLKYDEEPLVRFQKHVASLCARDAFIRANDPAKAFNGEKDRSQLPKTAILRRARTPEGP